MSTVEVTYGTVEVCLLEWTPLRVSDGEPGDFTSYLTFKLHGSMMSECTVLING